MFEKIVTSDEVLAGLAGAAVLSTTVALLCDDRFWSPGKLVKTRKVVIQVSALVMSVSVLVLFYGMSRTQR
jgi:hypothetical protein